MMRWPLIVPPAVVPGPHVSASDSHFALQRSPGWPLFTPSSHCSPASTVPSPHAVAFGADLVPLRRQLGSRAPNVLALTSMSFWHFVPPWTISLTIPASDLTI